MLARLSIVNDYKNNTDFKNGAFYKEFFAVISMHFTYFIFVDKYVFNNINTLLLVSTVGFILTKQNKLDNRPSSQNIHKGIQKRNSYLTGLKIFLLLSAWDCSIAMI